MIQKLEWYPFKTFLWKSKLEKLKLLLKPFSLWYLSTFSSFSIINQANRLGLPLCLVPIPKPQANEYVHFVSKALDHLEQQRGTETTALVFGDLHLEDLKAWRQQFFENAGESGSKRQCVFPLFGLHVKQVLLPRLDRLVREDGVSIEFSSVESMVMRAWLDRLDGHQSADKSSFMDAVNNASWPEEVDYMGENGEFHTRVFI